ncbi:hypothetical protein BD779DRAFT_1447634 [Infundibulicybe gibba]|nr:hypothetical protein BD779DRAFT_1447634 [Infundibulicybe gibba]
MEGRGHVASISTTDSISSELTLLPTPLPSRISPKSPLVPNARFANGGSGLLASKPVKTTGNRASNDSESKPTETAENQASRYPEPAYIPNDTNFRTLVLCFDGTGDHLSPSDAVNSNIVGLFTMLKKDDPEKQMVYYQAGIGTYTTPEIAIPFAAKVSKGLDEAVAWNLDAHVMGRGYEFLMQNHRSGDRICMFGFSRGAYIARSLAGMIHRVGLLTPCNHQQVPFAYKMFTRTDDDGWEQSNAFKRAFSIDVDIEFIGVWDTINSVGLIPKHLPFTSSNRSVRTFRHALALDERRVKFKANHWNRPRTDDKTRSITDRKKIDWKRRHADNGACGVGQHAQRYLKDPTRKTDVEEVWFAGCHCDVGGGSVPNTTTTNLARIPLRWMIRECFKTNSGIIFDVEGLRDVGFDYTSLIPDPLTSELPPRPPALPLGSFHIASIPPPVDKKKEKRARRERSLGNYADGESDPSFVVNSVSKSEEQLDLEDALSPIYDQLSLARFWWLLEYIPLEQRYQKPRKAHQGNLEWGTSYKLNRGEARIIPEPRKETKVRIHRSVRTRIEAGYTPRAKLKDQVKFEFDPKKMVWVD